MLHATRLLNPCTVEPIVTSYLLLMMLVTAGVIEVVNLDIY